jgi:hypothetical protein
VGNLNLKHPRVPRFQHDQCIMQHLTTVPVLVPSLLPSAQSCYQLTACLLACWRACMLTRRGQREGQREGLGRRLGHQHQDPGRKPGPAWITSFQLHLCFPFRWPFLMWCSAHSCRSPPVVSLCISSADADSAATTIVSLHLPVYQTWPASSCTEAALHFPGCVRVRCG